MSDFDAFTGSDAPADEVDPAADFLAREQEELAELNDDNFTGADFSDQQQATEPAAENTEGEQAPVEDDLAQFETQAEPSVPNDDVGGFGGYDALGDGSQGVPASLDIFNAPQQSGSGGNDFGFGGGSGEAIPGLDALDQCLDQEDAPAASDPYSSVRSVDTQRKEPEKIRIWREQQKEMLENKDKEEAVKMEEWREQARKELDDWYRHRDEQFQKAKALNRESEAEFIKERDESLPGHEWERICRLCEFNPKNNRSQKDASRMRSILLQLKQNPTVQAKVM